MTDELTECSKADHLSASVAKDMLSLCDERPAHFGTYQEVERLYGAWPAAEFR
jgi:hypothetical protein